MWEDRGREVEERVHHLEIANRSLESKYVTEVDMFVHMYITEVTCLYTCTYITEVTCLYTCTYITEVTCLCTCISLK